MVRSGNGRENVMKGTLLGGLLLVLGVVAIILSALADPLGLGSGGGFGWKQIVGVIVGGLVLIVGAIVFSRARRIPEPKPRTDAA